METLNEITRLCRLYVDARDARDKVADIIKGETRTAVRQNLRKLRDASARMATHKEALVALIAEHPDMFEKPRTRAIDGVKVGYQKKPGRIEVSDEENTIRLIRKKLPGQADTLIVTKARVDKNALKKLTVRELASVGATLGEDTDQIVVTLAATDLDKLADALLSEYKDEQLEAAP